MLSSKPLNQFFEQQQNYKIDYKLGEGGMGDVYLASDLRLERKVAIKSIKSLKKAPRLKPHLLQEAKILAQLNHPNIVQIYDIIEYSDNCSIVMEYVDGQSLEQVLNQKLVNLTQRQQWLIDICNGLVAAHAQGIIHRDLKPANILINRNLQAKISDFGIAFQIKSVATHQVSGTFNYMSPEQLAGKPLDCRSDLYSFGILAFQLLCGAHPASINTEINNKQTPPELIGLKNLAKYLNPDIPPSLTNLLAQLLEEQPDKRPDNANTVLLQLQKDCAHKHSPTSVDLLTVSPATQLALPSESFGLKLWLIKNWWRLSAVLSVLVLCLYLILPVKTTLENYVVVMPPIVQSEQPFNSKLLQQLSNAVFLSIQNSITELDNVGLLMSDSAAPKNTAGKVLARQLGANEIVNSQLTCNQQNCEVLLSRVNSQNGQVIKLVSWPMLTDSLLQTSQSTQLQTQKLFGSQQKQSQFSETISESDYQRYLAAYQQGRIEKINELENLALLSSIQQRAPRFLPLYELYREIALNLFSDTHSIELLNDAENLMRQAQRIYPHHIEIYTHLFWIKISQSDFDGAQQWLNKISQIDIDQLKSRELLAYLKLQQGDYVAAEQHYSNLLKQRVSRKTLYNLALVKWYQNQMPQTQMLLNQLFELSPEDYSANRLLAAVELTLGNLDAAIAAYQVLLNSNRNTNNHSNLGLAYMLNGNFDLAYMQLSAATKLSPENPDAQLNLADAEKLTGKHLLAEKRYQQVLTLLNNKSDWKSLLLSSQALAQLGKKQQAIQYLQQAQHKTTQNSELLFSASLVYTLVGDTTSAIVNIDAALNQNIGSVWYQLPWFSQLCPEPKFIQLMTQFNPNFSCKTIGS